MWPAGCRRCAGCIGIVLFFKESSGMEAAYGLTITLTMLMTTILVLISISMTTLDSE